VYLGGILLKWEEERGEEGVPFGYEKLKTAPSNHILLPGFPRKEKFGSFSGGIFWPVVEYRIYPACGRYFQPYSAGGSSDAVVAILQQVVFINYYQ